jgi:hypothetical protein
MPSVTLKDFQPINNWKVDSEGEKFVCCPAHRGAPRFLIDETTGRRYLNESSGVVGFKCFLLTLGTPFVHPLAMIANLAYRILKIVTLSHFWAARYEKYTFEERLTELGKDLLRIVANPIAIVGLELAAIYGWFRPYDGRKLYATIERATYESFILAPCFQPEPEYHAFGGDIQKRNAF